MHTDSRLQTLDHWLKEKVGLHEFKLTNLAGDASFRRYFRVQAPPHTYVLMDAPPEHEDCHPFVDITQRLQTTNINVPHLHHFDLEQGFLLLGDLGDELYLHHLSRESVTPLYQDAINTLLRIQTIDPTTLPIYNHTLLLQEMNLFRHWFLERHVGLKLTDAMSFSLAKTFEQLAQSALSQPQVFVHRDYHSRNLLLTRSSNPGVIDYQDAVGGPVTYDLVSLLRDCYIAWPNSMVEAWAMEYLNMAVEQEIMAATDSKTFLKWFDLMGMQRHLKAVGIFARLNQRDSKPGYLKDIPRTLSYIVDVSARYPETSELHELITSHIPTKYFNL